MAKLPFKTSKTKTSESISDGLGNSIDIPKLGCLTPNEKLSYIDCKYNLSTKPGITPIEYEITTVAKFLSHRFDTEINDNDLIEQAGSFNLIHALYEFLDNEDRAWQPKTVKLEVEGDDAEDVVFSYITKYSQDSDLNFREYPVAATREDLLVFKRWLIFSSVDVVPDGYKIYRFNPKTKKVGELLDRLSTV